MHGLVIEGKKPLTTSVLVPLTIESKRSPEPDRPTFRMIPYRPPNKEGGGEDGDDIGGVIQFIGIESNHQQE